MFRSYVHPGCVKRVSSNQVGLPLSSPVMIWTYPSVLAFCFIVCRLIQAVQPIYLGFPLTAPHDKLQFYELLVELIDKVSPGPNQHTHSAPSDVINVISVKIHTLVYPEKGTKGPHLHLVTVKLCSLSGNIMYQTWCDASLEIYRPEESWHPSLVPSACLTSYHDCIAGQNNRRFSKHGAILYKIETITFILIIHLRNLTRKLKLTLPMCWICQSEHWEKWWITKPSHWS